MKRDIVILLAITLVAYSLSAQDTFIYRMGGEKMYLQEDSVSIVISFKTMEYTSDSIWIASIVETIDGDAQYEMLTPRMMILQTEIQFDSIVNILSEYSGELNVSKVYYPDSDTHIHWCNNRIVVILQSENLLRSLLSQLSIEYENISVFNREGVYILTLPGIEDRSIQVSNLLYETGQVISAQPDFCFLAEMNNAHYGDQWGLHNTGQYGQAYSGIDINAPEAWDITRGNNIEVAVIDCGVDLTHPDLYNNILPGYDATGEVANGGCDYDNKNGHGTACAGIIAAENNNIGVVGVASSSKIIPIRLGRIADVFGHGEVYVSTVSQTADAINKAWNEYEADVLSISLSMSDVSIINIEIDSALNYGRNGNGCVIVASSGNYYSNGNQQTSVCYPASDSRVIAVGAISTCGERKTYQSCDGETDWGSCYGPELSVVAPGVLIPTTDIQGINSGYNQTNLLHLSLGGSTSYAEEFWDDYDYTKYFAGTSAAAPHVSGVAALMLSVNPNLTTAQVKTIIEKTAQRIRNLNTDPINGLYNYTISSDHPNGLWNNQMGYGLVDAHRAVMEAYFYNHYIDGDDEISACDILYYELSSTAKPDNTTVQWSVTSNLEIVSSNNAGAYIKAVGTGTGTITVGFTHEGCTVSKEIQVTITGMPTMSYYYNYSSNGNATINSSYINGTFTVNSGDVITITGSSLCFPDAKFVVQPGGKLIIDDAKIANYCPNKMWDGIYVVGNKNLTQLAANQGTLEIKNNSVIENAKCAVVTWNGNDNNTSGGIVKCINSTFRNNRRSINFLEYTNHTTNGAEIGNVGYVKKCTFLVNDNNIFASNGITFGEFVKISHVKGISFGGSTFRDARATASSQTKGIWSIGAGYTASSECSLPYNINNPCTCPGIETRPKFSRLGYGIYADNSGSTYNLVTDHAIFDTCYRSVYMSAVNNSNITRGDFDQSSQGTFTSSFTTGVYMINCNGYTIEGNNFSTNYTTRPYLFQGRAIYVSTSGSDNNTIYRNNISNLYHGIRTYSNNSGLQMQCNEFSNIFNTDMLLDGQVSSVQGATNKSAGNKFTIGATYNISASNSLTYYHSGQNVQSNVFCPYNSSSPVTLVPNITANSCNSTICLPPINPPIVDPILGKSASANEDITLYESLQQIYESRLADYNAAGYDFLLENFEEGDADIVATARLMQDTLISLRRAMAEIANRNINAILQDTIVFDRDALNGWYNRINTQIAKYSLVNSYFEVGEYALARQELAAIPQHFALTTDELAEYDNFCQYHSLRESVYTDGRNYARLTEDEIAELQVIAERSTGVSSAYANSVLCFFYGICPDEEQEFDFDIEAPVNSKSTTAVSEESIDAEPLAIYVYPNPANNELNILLNSLPEGRTMIEFHDVAGRLLMSQEITSTNARIDISSLPQGVYMCRIVNGDNIIARDRIMKE